MKYLQMVRKWILSYVISILILMLGIVILNLEPKILEVAVNYVQLERGIQNEPSSYDFITDIIFNLVSPLYDHGIGKVLVGIAGVYIATTFLRGITTFVASSMIARTTENGIHSLRTKIFGHIQKLPVKCFANGSKGNLIQLLNQDISTIKSFFQNQIVSVVNVVGPLLFSFLMIGIVNIYCAMISICLMPLVIWWGGNVYRIEKRLYSKSMALSDILVETSRENLSAMRAIIALNTQAHELKKFRMQNEMKRKSSMRFNKIVKKVYNTNEILLSSQMTISFIAAGIFALQGYITFGQMLSFCLYSGMMAVPLSQIGPTFGHLARVNVSIKRVMEVASLKIETDVEIDDFPVKPVLGKIEFRGVYFRYPNQQKWSLENISFTINDGEKAAFIGRSGSGKSTIFNLLLRFYEQTQGDILIDDRHIETYSKALLRNKFGYSLQQPVLFSNTLRENIAFGTYVDEEQFQRMVSICNMDPMRTELPAGLDTIMGEKGISLSGGQRQRASLARTLIRKPDVLILDNVNASLDSSTERKVFDNIFLEFNRNTIMISTHRLNLVKRMDKIFVLRNGLLIESGTPTELKEKSGYLNEVLNARLDLI